MTDANIPGLSVEVDRGVGVVTLDRPEKMNTLTQAMLVGLWDTLCAFDADDAVRAVVVTGRGRVFSAGTDLSGDRPAFSDEPVVYRHRPWRLRTPVIGALNGSAVGVALTLACQWDIRIVAEDAKLGFVFARRGIVPEAASAWTLPRHIGMSRAMELMLTGRHFSGAEAAEFGLASRAVPREEVLPVAMEIARTIAEQTSPASVSAIKGLLWASVEVPTVDEALALDEEVYAWSRTTPDPREGVAAFLDRRPPVWPSRKTGDYPDALRRRGLG